jgi:hypothetical protein
LMLRFCVFVPSPPSSCRVLMFIKSFDFDGNWMGARGPEMPKCATSKLALQAFMWRLA